MPVRARSLHSPYGAVRLGKAISFQCHSGAEGDRIHKSSTIHCGLRQSIVYMKFNVLKSLKAIHNILWIAANGRLLFGSVMSKRAMPRHSPLAQ